jgi:phosphatidylglycerophosphate synthase
MFRVIAPTERWRRALAAPLPALALAALVLVPVAGWVGAALAPRGALAGAAVAVFAAMVAVALRRWPHRVLGPANLVTLSRGALGALLVAPIIAPPARDSTEAWLLAALALLALLLDGLDGALARRSGLAGAWGARFDVEVDSAFAALLALASWRMGEAGAWIIALGTVRYAWIVVALAVPHLNGPLPERWSRKAVCVVQIGTMVALLSPLVEPPLSGGLALAALALVLWSFLVDARWLLR